MGYFNVMLRVSILYASETYHSITETQLRNIEKIEEEYLRKIMKTKKSCPINQISGDVAVASQIPNKEIKIVILQIKIK